MNICFLKKKETLKEREIDGILGNEGNEEGHCE
jgi:hypothetical protein